MKGDLALRVYPPAVVESARVARTTAQVALELGGGLRSLAQGPVAFLPTAAAAFARLQATWFGELDRIATAVSDLGDRAEQAAADYVLTDRTVGALTGSG